MPVGRRRAVCHYTLGINYFTLTEAVRPGRAVKGQTSRPGIYTT